MAQKFLPNVVHIASGDLWAGAEVQLFTLLKTLHGLENVSVRALLLNHGELETRLRERGIPVEVLDESRLNSIQILWRLIQYLKLWRPNVVHTHRLKENLLGGVAARLAGNIPSLRTVHGAPEHRPGWRKPHKQILYTLENLVGRLLQRKIIVVSQELEGQLRNAFPAAKIAVIENGVDIEALAPYIKPTDDPQKAPSPRKIALVGRLVPVKRVDVFLETAKYLKDHHPGFSAQFHIYGDGPQRRQLENLSVSLGVQDMVYFAGHCTEIYPEMSSLDALLITSDHEGLPMTLLEAMALGVPVIAHAVGGIPHALAEGDSGRLVMQQQPSAYASAVIELFGNLTQREKLIASAHARIQAKYSAYTNAESYLAQYQSFISNDGGA